MSIADDDLLLYVESVGLFTVAKDFTYYSPLLGRNIVVPRQLPTDGETVPRIPFIYSAFAWRCVKSAIVHDYLYSSHEVKRRIADKVFYQAMLEEGVKKYHAIPIYLAVRLFGWSRY
jgi:Protein of unknown function (DUF1353)